MLAVFQLLVMKEGGKERDRERERCLSLLYVARLKCQCHIIKEACGMEKMVCLGINDLSIEYIRFRYECRFSSMDLKIKETSYLPPHTLEQQSIMQPL